MKNNNAKENAISWNDHSQCSLQIDLGQFWGDVHIFHEWRIQRNVCSGHYRLLDAEDHRHASGTLPVCRVKLDEIRKSRKLPPMSGKAVIVRFIDTKEIVWIGSIINFIRGFNGGLDADNKKVFEIIVEK